MVKTNFVYLLYVMMPKNFKKITDSQLHKFGPNWAQNALSQKENFVGKLTNNTLI